VTETRPDARRRGGDAPIVRARTFACDLRAPRAARHFLLVTLAGWGRADLAGDGALVVTELATNAVLHARSGFTVAVSLRHGAVRVSVRDAARLEPAPRRPTTLATSGRGLRMVEAISHGWGTTVAGEGKAVWAELRPGEA